MTQLLTLKLDSNQFEEFPAILCQMRGLKRLSMTKNRLRELPEEVRGMESLKDLDLFMNSLGRLPEALALLHLQTLSLRANKLSTLPQLCETLRDLDVSSNQLECVPAALFELSLERLQLVGNNIRELLCFSQKEPFSPMQLSLTHLDVSHNEVERLPCLALPILRTLRLESNKITTLDSVEGMPELVSLNLDRNLLHQVCAELQTLTKLRTLLLGYNSFHDLQAVLPASLREVSLGVNQLQAMQATFPEDAQVCLAKLYLPEGELKAIPECVAQMVSLRVLDLRKNRLCSSPSLHLLTSLVQLDLGCNELSALPAGLSAMHSLLELNLARNKLEGIPSEVFELPSLQILNVFGNRIREVPCAISRLSRLSSVYLGANQLHALPQELLSLRELRSLHASNNMIASLSDNLVGLVHLEELYLGQNRLSEFPTQCADLEALCTLDLSANAITTVELAYPFERLTELMLAQNLISQLNCSMRGGFEAALPSLVLLDVSKNPLTSVPALSAQGSLQILNMMHCQIQSLKTKVPLGGLCMLYLQGNPLDKATKARLRQQDARTDLALEVSEAPRSRWKPFWVERPAAPSSTWVGQPSLVVSWSEIRGARETQEDTLAIQHLGASRGHLFGVFDGHRGDTVAHHCAANFPQAFREGLRVTETPRSAVAYAFERVQLDISRKGLTDGSTAAVCYVTEREVVLANLGDSRAVLYTSSAREDGTEEHSGSSLDSDTFFHGDSIIRASATRDHTGNDPRERRRIEQEQGGYVSAEGRVQGDIAVSRALGDDQFAPFILSQPSITVIPRVGIEKFVIVACDGLWDVLSNKEAFGVIVDYLEAGGDTSQAALVLRDYAYSLGSRDNISCVSVVF